MDVRTRKAARTTQACLAFSLLMASAVAGALAAPPRIDEPVHTVIRPHVASPTPSATPGQPAGAGRIVVLPRPQPTSMPLPMPSQPFQGHLSHVSPGQTISLRLLPPLRRGMLGHRHAMSASGANINVLTQSGCGTTIGTIYNVGCTVSWQAQNLATCTGGGADTCHQDYFIDANAATATAVGSAYNATSGSSHSTTLSNNGTYVFAELNSDSNDWDAIVYVTVGTIIKFGTFSDSSDTVATTNFVASSANTVYVNATGLTPTDNYVVYVESTSITGHCVFIAPTASPAPGATLCNPSTSPGENAVGGSINVAWTLSSSLAAGTYSVVIYDLTTGNRLAQREVVLTSSGATVSWSLTPTGGNASPAPAPAGTPGSIFAFDATTDESDKSLTLAAHTGTSADNFKEVVTDPNGAVVYSSSTNPNGSGNISLTWNFAQSQSPENYIGHTYSLTLLDTTSNTITAAKAFQILGYNVQGQFTSPVGNSLSINTPATSATSGLQFTNAGDLSYGSGNGDAVAEIQFDTGSQGITAILGSSATSCGTNCLTQTVLDTAGNGWTVTDVSTTNGANADSTITITPVNAGTTLAVGASITVPNITFNNPPGSHCSSGCTLTESMLPADGITWSNTAQSFGGNPLYITNGFGSTYAATGHIALYGERASGTLTAANDVHGFAPNFTQAIYDATQPFSAASGAQDVLALTVKNTSSAGSGSITKMQITFPANFTVSSAAIDAASPTTWSVQTCPGGTASNVLCIQHAGANSGIAANGGSEAIYIDINPPTSSFLFTDVGVSVTAPANFSMTADGTSTVFADSAYPTVDSNALGGFSLDSTKITPLIAPGTVGSNTSTAVTMSVQNASTTADANPDYLDAVVIEVPTTNALSGVSTSTSGWSYLGSSISGSNTRYWFGMCAAQFSAANGPATNPPPATSASLPNCGQATEAASAIAPGNSLTINATIPVTTSNVSLNEYAHGANGDGWSKATPFTLTVNAIAVTSGFSKVGTYGSPSSVTTNTTPQTSADTNTTYGNSYVYEIKNISSSGSGQNVTSATITVPGLDIGGANGTDASGTAWTITSAPTVTLSGGASGCSVQSYSSATSGGANGSIVVGGASCSIPPGGIVDVNFSAKAPYKINTTYKFGMTYTGGSPACSPSCAASEAWFSDTDIQVVLSANLVITVDPSAGPGGSMPSPNCPICVFSAGSVQFGTVANGSSATGTDVVTVSVYTDAANNNGWKLYVSADSNPANTGSPTNEFLTAVDQSASNQSGEGLNFDQTTMTVVPTSGVGSTLVDTGSGANPRRLPYDVVMSYQISIQGGPITQQTANVTYTFIAQ